MAFEEQIEKIIKGFNFRPEISGDKPEGFRKVVACGMGGSHLGADFLASIFSNLYVHKSYGLPNLPEEDLGESLFIAVSHSGETEETLDFAKSVLEKGYKLVVISGGGELLDFARENSISYIRTPTDIPARMSVGFQINAILSFMSEDNLSLSAEPVDENLAQSLGDFVGDSIPVIYASGKNISLANYFKIVLNESSKIPAFINVFPEMNHNELNSFHQSGKMADFRFLVLRDLEDNPKIQKRMEVFQKIFEEEGAKVLAVDLMGRNQQKVLNFVLLANYLSLIIAKKRGVDPEETLLIEKFKKEV